MNYTYQIAKYETTIAQWEAFYNDPSSGKVGSFNFTYHYWSSAGADAPAVRINRHQASQYCNWLTTGSATNGAYTIDESGAVTSVMSREDIIADGSLFYVLPTENEWYKAAYYSGDGLWSLYANGTGIAPIQGGTDGWNYAADTVWTVGSGGEEQNGTFDMMGNVWEWLEDVSVIRGGSYSDDVTVLRSSTSIETGILAEDSSIGFRVVAIPEPATALTLAIGGLLIGFYRRFFRQL